jgi:hypothetical protein
MSYVRSLRWVVALHLLLGAACSGRARPSSATLASGVTSARPAPAQAPRAPDARVLRARSADDLCTGPNAVGRPGDWVLDNGVIRAVIDDVRTGGGGFALSGGQLVDLTRVETGARTGDELGQVFNFLGSFPRQLQYADAASETGADGSASVIVRGEDPRTPGLRGATRYTLRPGRCAIELRTTLEYMGESPTEVGLGDAIQWAGAEHWAPGFGYSVRGEQRLPWIAGVGREAAYALAAEGSTALFGPHGGAWSNPMQRRVTLARGESVTYVRAIGVGRTWAVHDALDCAGWTPPRGARRVRVRVRDAQGAPFAGAQSILEGPDGKPRWMSVSDRDGIATGSIEGAGPWRVRVTAPGRAVRVAGDGVVPDGTPDGAAGTDIVATVGRESGLRVAVQESGPVDARVLVYGVDGTPDPMFGAIGRGDGARNSVLVSHRAPREVPLAAGTYRVVATRGGFYTLGEARVTVGEGETKALTLTVRRVIDPERRWMCGDFHTHQAPSLDSPVSTRDRVLAAAAEGLDVLAATDHNVATDLSAAVSAEDLERTLFTMGGDEVSTDVAVHPTGHWNLYPLRVDPALPLGGAPSLFELTPEELVARVRREAPAAVIQLNHPRSGAPTGMFDVYGFDAGTGRAARPGFSSSFDALEVWNGRYQSSIDRIVRDWMALLRAGARITGVANSDSHAIATQEVGYPRSCFRGSFDWSSAGTSGPSPDAQVREAMRGTRDVVMTDGPLLEVLRPDGRSAVGADLTADSAGEYLTIRAQSVAWAPADSLERTRADGSFELISGTRIERDGDRVRVEARVRVLATDGPTIFRVRGSQPISVLVGEPALVPMALSNPVRVLPRSRGARGARAAGRR